MSTSSSGRGRAPRSPSGTHTRSSIVAAARLVVEQEGIDALTLRRVAQELGTGPMSLYRHIRNRDELLRLLIDDLAGDYPIVEADGRSAVDLVLAQWMVLRSFMLQHRWFATLVAEGRGSSRASIPAGHRLLAQIGAAGLDATDGARLYRTLWMMLLGSVLNLHHFGEMLGAEPRDDDFEWAVLRVLDGALASRPQLGGLPTEPSRASLQVDPDASP